MPAASPSAPLPVLAVVSELYPFVKTGGLADVAYALPLALAGEGTAVRTLVPGYPAVLGAVPNAQVVAEFDALFGGPARLLAARAQGLDLLVLEAPHLYARIGNPYLGPGGKEWPDNAQRFAALAQAAAAIGRGAVPGYAPQIVHAHDWQAGLAPAYLHYGQDVHHGGAPRPHTVMTVHNLGFQGQFAQTLLAELGLPPESWAMNGVEYYGGIGFLKAGLALADRVTTVSPTYAAEIRTPEFGMGLDGLLRLRAHAVSGILNGLDTQVWNPATDPSLAQNYDAGSLDRRAANKAALQAQLGLAADPKALLYGVVSRLSWQKGLDLLLEALPTLVGEGAQLALVGTGDAALEEGFRAAADEYPGRIGVLLGYDETLAHRVQGGADALLVPSRYEPCGLTQLAALRYGCVPVVARVGGLADTVVDANEMALAQDAATGLLFAPVTRERLELALARTGRLWRDRAAWRQMQRRGMASDVSWALPARRYAELFRELVG
jgi:starch synthase